MGVVCGDDAGMLALAPMLGGGVDLCTKEVELDLLSEILLWPEEALAVGTRVVWLPLPGRRGFVKLEPGSGTLEIRTGGC